MRASNVEGLTDVREILEASHSNYRVGLGRLALTDAFGGIVTDGADEKIMADILKPRVEPFPLPGELPEKLPAQPGGVHASVRINPDGEMMMFGVVGSQYTVVQNESIVRDAQEIATASEGEGRLVFAGNYRGGRVFFAGVGFEPVSVDVGSYKETFRRALLVYLGHDGTLAHHYGYLFEDIHTGHVWHWFFEKKKHFSQVQDRVSVSTGKVRTLNYMSDVLIREVQEMATIQLPPNSEVLASLVDVCARSVTTQNKANAKQLEEFKAKIMSAYLNSQNSGRRGCNGWGLYTAFIEVDDVVRHRIEGNESGLKLMQKRQYVDSRNKVRHAIMASYSVEK
jgi:hypothetical protein